MIVAFASDYLRHRFLFTILPICLAIAGFAILLNVHTRTDIEYAALHLICLGTYGSMPVIICWFQMNLGGHHRRAIGTAWQIGFGNIGGIIRCATILGVSPTLPCRGLDLLTWTRSTYAFLAADAPFYHKGYSICIAFICLSAVSCCLYAAALVWENKRRDKAVRDVGMTEYEKTELGVSDRQRTHSHALGKSNMHADINTLFQDLNPEFRYML